MHTTSHTNVCTHTPKTHNYYDILNMPSRPWLPLKLVISCPLWHAALLDVWIMWDRNWSVPVQTWMFDYWGSMQQATHLYIWQNFHQCCQFLLWNELVRTKVLLQFNFNKRVHLVICDQSLCSVSRSPGGHNLTHNLFLFLKQCITIYAWLTDQWRECIFIFFFWPYWNTGKYRGAFYRDANGWILLHREW